MSEIKIPHDKLQLIEGYALQPGFKCGSVTQISLCSVCFHQALVDAYRLGYGDNKSEMDDVKEILDRKTHSDTMIQESEGGK